MFQTRFVYINDMFHATSNFSDKKGAFWTKIAKCLLDIIVRYRYSGPTQSNVDCDNINNTSNTNKKILFLSSILTMFQATDPLQPVCHGGSPSPFDTQDIYLTLLYFIEPFILDFV